MPAVVVVAVVVIAGVAGVEGFIVADSNSGTRPGAPIQAIIVWMAWFIPLTAIGTFVTLLAYLLVLPARSRGLWITQIVLTSLAAFVALGLVVGALQVLAEL